jgi:signal transduction histidine kinase
MSADLDRFRQLVEDLLEISRVDVGAVTLHLAPVLVTELVIQAVATSSHGNVPVHYDPEAADLGVMVDKVRFFRAIDNLLANAANYADGATAVDVNVHHSEEGDTVRIGVEDDGVGVPEEERHVIFDRFSRGREGGNRGADSGTGLGLALVDEHIRLHNGRVWVEDRLDGTHGARFVIELPVMAEPSAGGDDGEGTYVDDDYGLDEVIPDSDTDVDAPEADPGDVDRSTSS